MNLKGNIIRAAALCASALTAAGCGGGGSEFDNAEGTGLLAAPTAEHVSSKTSTRAPRTTPGGFGTMPGPLLDDEGLPGPSDPRAIPVDRGARTRAGLYALPAQARALEQALQGRVLRIDIECCGVEVVDRAVATAHGVQAAADMAESVPVLVSGPDQRLAAVVANRLADAGHSAVWMVVSK